MNDLSSSVELAFSDSGPLAQAVSGFEAREGQRAMAAAVASAITAGGTLLAEAGTGTGKTLAYLVPAILSRQRVLVSTGTKNLQEQIFFKDLPALREALDVPFTATLMKGRSNYLCLHRYQLYRDGATLPGPRLIDTSDRILLPVIDAWLAETTTGDRAELRDLPEDLSAWKDINADAETCLGSECPRYGDCFVTLMRQRAAESDVVIVNHHLLCADAAVRQSEYGEVIPACATLVVDEAHQLEDVATQYFGVAFSNFRVEDLVRDGARVAALQAAHANRDAAGPGGLEGIHRDLERITERSRIFFSGLSMRLDSRSAHPEPGRGGGFDRRSARTEPRRSMSGASAPLAESRARYTAEAMGDHFEHGMMLAGAIEGLESSLALAPRPPDGSEAMDALQRRAGELRTDPRFLMRATEPEFVYFLEVRGRGIHLRASPIDVSRIVREALFSRMRATILTSATLAVDGSFSYLRGRLGIHDADELRVASEFDYARQALLYLPRTMPPPKTPAFAEAAAREVVALVTRSRGRAFVLFTSYAVLRIVQRVVEMSLPYPILVQGTAPRSALIEQFRTTPNAVLLATSSFWQGVDVVGEALSCVIIDKLPFASPGDPITAARIEAINAGGGDAFSD